MKNNDTRFVAKLLEDRRSTRKFLPDFKISDEQMKLIVEAARYSPSSYGILNSRLIVIENKEFRKKLIPYFYYQTSFSNCSAYLLFVVDKGDYILSESIFKAKDYIKEDDTFSKYQIDLGNLVGAWDDKFNTHPEYSRDQWSIEQAYIQMTAAMIQAEQLGLDTTPHEGFNRDKLDQFLIENNEISNKETIAIGLAIGKVDMTKRHANNKEKVRKDLKNFVSYIK